jgi:hypothetical protein
MNFWVPPACVHHSNPMNHPTRKHQFSWRQLDRLQGNTLPPVQRIDAVTGVSFRQTQVFG